MLLFYNLNCTYNAGQRVKTFKVSMNFKRVQEKSIPPPLHILSLRSAQPNYKTCVHLVYLSKIYKSGNTQPQRMRREDRT